jgi:hypothetical protein
MLDIYFIQSSMQLISFLLSLEIQYKENMFTSYRNEIQKVFRIILIQVLCETAKCRSIERFSSTSPDQNMLLFSLINPINSSSYFTL